MRHSYLLTAKTTSDVNNSLIFTGCKKATVGKSLQLTLEKIFLLKTFIAKLINENFLKQDSAHA